MNIQHYYVPLPEPEKPSRKEIADVIPPGYKWEIVKDPYDPSAKRLMVYPESTPVHGEVSFTAPILLHSLADPPLVQAARACLRWMNELDPYRDV